MIVWITGLSAAGKTTIGREVCHLWRSNEPNTVFIDGDEIRQLFKHDRVENDYSIAARRVSSERMVSLCEWLDSQGINAVSANIAMFSDIRRQNRQRYHQYYEVYLDVSLNTLRKRDPKGLYASYDAGKIKNVVGLDIPFENAPTQDMTLKNNLSSGHFKEAARKILNNVLLTSNKTPSVNANTNLP